MRATQTRDCAVQTHATIGSPLADVSSRTSGNHSLDDIVQKLILILAILGANQSLSLSKKAISVRSVMAMTGFSRSHLYAIMSSKSDSHDSTFPQPFHVGKSTRFWHHEVSEWLESKAASSRAVH